MFRRRRDEFCAADDMGDAHEMVVDDVREVIGRHAIALQQDLILELLVLYRDIAVQHIEIGRFTAERHLLADDVGIAVFQVLVNDLLRQVAAGAVIAAEFAGRVILVRIAEAVIGMAEFDELFGVFLVYGFALALDVRSVVAAEARSLIGDDVGSSERILYEIHGISDIARLVGVLDAQDEIAMLGFREQIGVERSAQIADMHITRRARSKTGTDSFGQDNASIS